MTAYKSQSSLLEKLDRLLRLPHETEFVEFKEAKSNYDFGKLGKYFSALSNEANLKQQACGWLIFGIRDDRSICGSEYRKDPAKLDGLKQEIAVHTTGNLTFIDIHTVNHANGRVIMFEMPPALQGIPTAWKGHWYGRSGQSLGPLGLSELDTIRSGSATGAVVDEFKKRLMNHDHMPESIRMKGELERDCDEPGDVRRRMLAERLFSKWLFELWNHH